jgi:hypothetical protein
MSWLSRRLRLVRVGLPSFTTSAMAEDVGGGYRVGCTGSVQSEIPRVSFCPTVSLLEGSASQP